MSDTPSPSSPVANIEQELAKVNREMYERNVELAVRNRTLSTLREMYEIINTSLDIQDTSIKLIDAIIDTLKFQKGFIALMNTQNNSLDSIAVSRSGIVSGSEVSKYQQPILSFSIPIDHTENICVASYLYKSQRMTNDCYDIFTPMIDRKAAEELALNLNIKTSVIYPIMFAGKVLGIMVLCMDKHVGYLSRAELETMRELIDVVAIAIERAQIYAALKSANKRLQDLDRLKDEFVSVASHELRTPMTAIKSYLWMALAGKGGNLNDKQKYYLERAYNSTDRLIKLVNDMLNVSRIEAGRVSLDVQKIDINTLAEDVIFEVKPRADELGLKVKLLKDKTLPPVIADTDKIKEVLINLIGNSLKFTPSGGVITIMFERKDSKIITHVKDTGKGIDLNDQPKLFQKFGLLKGSYTTNQASQGTGLGLYICKSIMELHKGDIWAFSEGRDRGTQFSFSLLEYTEEVASQLKSQQEGKEGIEIIHTAIT